MENKGVEEGLIGRRGNLRKRRGGADELQSDRQEGSEENKQQQERVKDVRGKLPLCLPAELLPADPPASAHRRHDAFTSGDTKTRSVPFPAHDPPSPQSRRVLCLSELRCINMFS